MFGWLRRRNDGFEWRDYVRTTVLARRARRRQQLQGAKEAAVESLIEAGKRGVEVGQAGASAAREGLAAAGTSAGAGLIAAARGALRWSIAAWNWFLDAVASRLAAAALFLLKAGGPALEKLRQPSFATPIATVAVVALLALLVRLPFRGFDWEAAIALAIAFAAGVLYFLPRATIPEGFNTPSFEFPRTPKDWLASLPNWSDLSLAARAASGTIVTVAVLGVAAVYAVYSVPGLERPSSSKTEASSNGRLVGRAVALSGDRIRIAGTILRLSGIEAPERDQTCTRPGSRRYNCGAVAKEALGRLIRGRSVSCEVSGRDGDNRPEGYCDAGGTDVASSLVKNGQVFAVHGFLARYSGLESEARAEKSGLWRGAAERPSEFRAKRWEEAARSAPDGCPIKGQMTSEGRVYVLPWSPDYQRARVRDGKGERWFCSEADARAAGWKPVGSS